MIIIHILRNISRRKGNQTMNLGQLIKHNIRYIFFQKSCRKWGRETSPVFLFVFFLKKTFRGKNKWSASCFQYKLVVLNLDIQKKLLIQKDAQFLFFRRDFETIFSTAFSVWFFKIKNQKNSNLQSDQVS